MCHHLLIATSCTPSAFHCDIFEWVLCKINEKGYFCHQDWLSISPRKYGEGKRNVNTNSDFLCIQAQRHIFLRRSRKLITTTCYSASLSSALISCLETNKHVSWFKSDWFTKAFLKLYVFFRFRYKGVVKNDINADYDTYGQEGDVDYITNENVYYEGDYDSMETSQNATVMTPPNF